MIQKMDINSHTPNQLLRQNTKTLQVDCARPSKGIIQGATQQELIGSDAGRFKGSGCHGTEFGGDGEDAFEGGVIVGLHDRGGDLCEYPISAVSLQL